MEEKLFQFGIAGIGLIALSWYILKRDADHKKERKEWMDRSEDRMKKSEERMEKMTDRVEKISDTTNTVLRENTNILSGLKTLLENNNK